ncbi:MAG: VWA domain-containing protein [Acidobacteriota bacterium]|nr:VWA domain-containing protein [Acidobacteriota bacterium]
MTKLNFLLLALLPLAATTGPSTAQDSAAFSDTVDVIEVLLDVVVSDRDGNVIVGLGPEDFVVNDAGQPVELTGTTFYSNRRPVDSDDSEIPTDRYFIFFFDDDPGLGPIVTRQKLEVVRRTREWVSEELLPNDYVAIVRYVNKLVVHQDFTTDRAALDSALDSVARGKDPGGNWPSRIEDSSGPSLRRALPQGNDLRDATTRIYSALETIAKAAGGTTGRKNLLFFSFGFGEVGNSGFFVPDRRYYPQAMQVLNDNNVAVYSISLNQNVDVSGGVDSSLPQIAAETGGRYYDNFNTYKTPLREIAKDNSGYYLLSYRARVPAGESAYREVTVETVNPRFVVRARGGYRTGD